MRAKRRQHHEPAIRELRRRRARVGPQEGGRDEWRRELVHKRLRWRRLMGTMRVRASTLGHAAGQGPGTGCSSSDFEAPAADARVQNRGASGRACARVRRAVAQRSPRVGAWRERSSIEQLRCRRSMLPAVGGARLLVGSSVIIWMVGSSISLAGLVLRIPFWQCAS